MDRTYGRREAVDERGVQPPEPPERCASQETQCESGEIERERQGKWRGRESNTLHIVLHLPTNTTPATATLQQQQQRQHDHIAEHDQEREDLVHPSHRRDCISATTSRDWRFATQ